MSNARRTEFVGLKLTKAELKRLDYVRRDISRSAWIRKKLFPGKRRKPTRRGRNAAEWTGQGMIQ
jgi:hypothetical protein